MPAAKRKLRLLALHGFRTSSAIFKKQLEEAGFDHLLSKHAHIVYLDAPNAATGQPDKLIAQQHTPPYFEWGNADQDKLGRWVMGDFYKSVVHVARFVKEQQPFDGLLGFSQGAFLGIVLMILQRQGILMRGVPRLRFCIFFAGIHTSNATYAALLDAAAPYNWPCVQFCSDTDPWDPLVRKLTNNFANPLVISHPQGHAVPTLNKQQVEQVDAFLAQQALPNPHSKL